MPATRKYRRTVIVVILATLLSSCAHISRTAATDLSQSGVNASTILDADVSDRVENLRAQRAAQDFDEGYAILKKCPAATVTHGTSNDANCDTAAMAKVRSDARVNASIKSLADVVAQRGKALQALQNAYAAFGDEAAYDEPDAVDKAIGPAIDAAKTYAAAAGAGPIAAVVAGGTKLAIHAIAANAQKRRLIKDSRQIATVTHMIRVALTKERDLFVVLDAVNGDLDDETRSTFLQAGLLDPSATVTAIADAAGVTLDESRLTATLSSDRALNGAGEVALLDTPKATHLGDLDAGIALLANLEDQHAQFEKGERLDAQRIAKDVGELASLLSLAKK